ncbi:MAG: SMC-Scp complex subunit ScpB [Clostridia bacterium]|nr:SMC-Scp complex subunit ScpB [Clostridia bacterium]
MAVLFPEETKGVIECVLFIANEPVSLQTICDIAEIEKEDALELLRELQEEYRQRRRGLQIIEIAKGFQLCTKPEFASYIERYYKPQTSAGLSKAALETLAIVAYKQPITRGEIELIRGVKVDKAIATLLEKDLIKEAGRKDGPGRPVLFGTTQDFLRYFGLKDLKDLPDPEEFIVQNTLEDEELRQMTSE